MFNPHYENKALPIIVITASDNGTPEGQRITEVLSEKLAASVPSHPRSKTGRRTELVAQITVSIYPPEEEAGQD